MPSDPTARSKERLARFIEEVWSEGRIERVPAYLAAAYTIAHDPGDPWEGRTLDAAGFMERVRQSRAPFPDQRFRIIAMIGEGDRVAITWDWAATHAGDLPGFPATGRRIIMTGATLYAFDGTARLTGHWQVADRLGVYRQLREAAPAG
jgi:predicted ester cyclase